MCIQIPEIHSQVLTTADVLLLLLSAKRLFQKQVAVGCHHAFMGQEPQWSTYVHMAVALLPRIGCPYDYPSVRIDMQSWMLEMVVRNSGTCHCEKLKL